MKIIPILDGTAPDVTVGRHALWAPRLGVKLPFQYAGRVVKYRHDEERTAPGDSIPHEIAILRALAARGMAPPIGEPVYVQTLISEHPGGWHADPCGAWGYEMADAMKLPPGRFSVEAMRQLPITGSPGAWNDIAVPGRDNVINGYLVDVRRTAWDMLRWQGPDLPTLPEAPLPSTAALAADVHARCQFPQRARDRAYQDFWLAGEWQRGDRRIVERANLMSFTPRPGETVLEIGCQSGGFLQLAHLAMRGEGTTIGVEVDPDYVECARALARHAGHNICFRQIDAVAEADRLLAWIGKRAPRGVDHLICASMEKHLGDAPLFRLIDQIGARRTYVETNAVSTGNPWKLRAAVEQRGGRHVADSTDRNLRRLYRIERAA